MEPTGPLLDHVAPAVADRTLCPVCATPAAVCGAAQGRYSKRGFTFRQCAACEFSYVEDPWTDFARIYDAAYYAGDGADPLVDYHFELTEPGRTIRNYEWRGILTAVRELAPLGPDTRWLDFGAGNGGLVRHVRATSGIEIHGFEDGDIAADAAALGIPFLTEEQLEARPYSFDVITAIEVLEHVIDPVAELRRMRRLLRPGGLLFLTTGNAAPHADKIAEWSYAIPEIHISFYTPRTLERAMEQAGFRPQPLGATAGVDEILKFKVLKNLRLRKRSRLTDVLPARAVAAPAERIAHMRAMPVGWAV